MPVDPEEFSKADLKTLPDVRLTLQSGLRYLNASWPVENLLKLYLAETAPDQLELVPARVWIEVSGARGEFQLNRLDVASFTFPSAFQKVVHSAKQQSVPLTLMPILIPVKLLPR